VGVLTVARDGSRYLCWCRDTDIIRAPKHRPVALDSRRLDSFVKHGKSKHTKWYLDQCTHHDGYHYLRGFAFKTGGDHYRYIKSLVLADKNGSAIQFDVHSDERIDVAYSFPQEHFLYNTGFVCYIFDSVLEKGREYDVIIRLTNQFDNADIIDISTEHKVKI